VLAATLSPIPKFNNMTGAIATEGLKKNKFNGIFDILDIFPHPSFKISYCLASANCLALFDIAIY
jgi:hypothetical protein